MDLHRIDWTPCIVFGASGNLRFGCPLKTGLSVLIPPIYSVEIGDFVDIKYKPQTDPNPNNRAQHVATDIRESEQPKPRIQVLHDKVIFFYTCAQVRQFDQFENKRVTLLHNDIFGCIIDLYQTLPLLKIGTIVEVECRLKESPKQKKNTIFVVTDYNKDNKNPRLPEKVESSDNNIPLIARGVVQPEDSDHEPPNTSLRDVSHIARLCDVSLEPMSSSDEQVQAVPEHGMSGEPNTSSQKVQAVKTRNKYAAKSKGDMLFAIFENDVMLEALKKRDKDLWAHVSNIIATGE